MIRFSWEVNKDDAYAKAVRITDNGFGKLVSDSCEGTIDYATGEMVLALDYEKLFQQRISGKINSFSETYTLPVIGGLPRLPYK